MAKFIYLPVLALFFWQCSSGDVPKPVVQEPKPEPELAEVSLIEKWTVTGLKTPESVLYDDKRNSIFISNINTFSSGNKDGFISLLEKDGSVKNLKWVTELNDPKGMAVRNDTLYVTDINEVVAIDIVSAKIAKRFPVQGAVFLNDITADDKGNIFISDSEAGKVYLLRNELVTVYLSGDKVAGANGLLAEAEGLIIASFSTGDIKRADSETKELTTWATGISSADGVVKDDKGHYFISGWEGEIWYVRKTGEKERLLSTRSGVQSADIGFINGDNLLLVPTFEDNRVMAYQVTYKE